MAKSKLCQQRRIHAYVQNINRGKSTILKHIMESINDRTVMQHEQQEKKMQVFQ